MSVQLAGWPGRWMDWWLAGWLFTLHDKNFSAGHYTQTFIQILSCMFVMLIGSIKFCQFVPLSVTPSLWPNGLKSSALRVGDPGFNSHLCHGDFSGLSRTSDFKTGTPVATLQGT